MPKPQRNIFFFLLSCLYGGITEVRNFLFNKELLRATAFPLPIISIGNLSVGGTGKTPHTEFLLDILSKEWKTAVLSRGYMRTTNGFRLAKPEDTAKTIGDEPFQIFDKFPETTVAVDEKRVRGAKELMKTDPEIDVIVLDDAYQHRHIKAGLSVLLTDFHNLYSEDWMLPYGTLREYKKNSNRADIVIVTKCDIDFKPADIYYYQRKLSIKPHQQLYFSAFEYGKLYPVFDKNVPVPSLTNESNVLLVTGVVKPEQVLHYLQQFTTKIEKMFFSDHHNFTQKELGNIERTFLNLPENKLIITTEKDASRLKSNPFLTENIKQNIFAIPLKIKILNNEHEKFVQKIQAYVRKNSRNG